MKTSNGMAYALAAMLAGNLPSRSQREQAERDHVLTKRMLAEGSKRDAMVFAYGSVSMKSEDGKLLMSGRIANLQRASIRHTTLGDFSHLSANPLIFK